MTVDTQATVTKLLTLLNVSAAKSTSKRRRTDSGSVGKLGRAQSQPQQEQLSAHAASAQKLSETTADGTAGDLDEVNDGTIPSRHPELFAQVVEVKTDQRHPGVRDPYMLHFGAHSSHLTDAAREAVATGYWSTKRRKLDHVGHVLEQTPNGQSTIEPADIQDAVRLYVQEIEGNLIALQILPKLLDAFPQDSTRMSHFTQNLLCCL
jgi:U3 small nucleolar RNA-associated protein 25